MLPVLFFVHKVERIPILTFARRGWGGSEQVDGNQSSGGIWRLAHTPISKVLWEVSFTALAVQSLCDGGDEAVRRDGGAVPRFEIFQITRQRFRWRALRKQFSKKRVNVFVDALFGSKGFDDARQRFR